MGANFGKKQEGKEVQEGNKEKSSNFGVIN